jgi:hypothetical protein
VDSLKALDPRRPIREADIERHGWHVRFVPTSRRCISILRKIGVQSLQSCPAGRAELPLFQRQRSCRSAGKNSEINRIRDCGIASSAMRRSYCISMLREEYHESTDHDDADGPGAAVPGGFFAGTAISSLSETKTLFSPPRQENLLAQASGTSRVAPESSERSRGSYDSSPLSTL